MTKPLIEYARLPCKPAEDIGIIIAMDVCVGVCEVGAVELI